MALLVMLVQMGQQEPVEQELSRSSPCFISYFFLIFILIFLIFSVYKNSFLFVSVRVQKKRGVEMHRHKSYNSPFLLIIKKKK